MVLNPKLLSLEILEELKSYKQKFGNLNSEGNIKQANEQTGISLEDLEKLIDNYSHQSVDSIPLRQRSNLDLQVDILAQFPFYLFWKDLDGTYCGCNKNYAEFLDLQDPNQIIGSSDHDLFDREMALRYTEHDQKVISSKSAVIDYEELKIEGSKTIQNIWKTPIKDDAGNLIGVLGFTWYRNDSLIAFRDVRQKEEDLSRVINHNPDLLIELDKQLCIKFLSPSVQSFLGYQNTDMIGEAISSWIHPHDWPRFSAEIQVNKSEFRNVIRMRHKSGDWMFIDSIVSSRDPSYKRVISGRLVNNSFDQNGYQDFFIRFADQAMRYLNEPLRRINHYLHLVEKEAKINQNEKVIDLLENAIIGADQIQLMFSGILQYNRLRKIKTNPLDTDLNVVLDTTKRLFGYEIYKDNINITHPDLPSIFAHDNQMNLLFQQLISNAIKFKRPLVRCEIEINFEDKGDYYIFSLKDNGTGFPSDKKQEVFKEFYRAHDFYRFRGAGLGLSMSKEIVQFHGGDIWCESKAGEGSVVYFTLKKDFFNSNKIIQSNIH